MRPSLEPRKISHKELTAPNLPISPKPRPIECHADYLVAQVVLRHATANVRMMMLHANLPLNIRSKRHLGTHIAWMQIIRSHARFYAKHVLHVFECLFKKAHRLVVLQVANMLAENRIPILRQAESVLQLTAERENLFHRYLQIDRLWHKPARAPENPLPTLKSANDRIINSRRNVPVMQQKPICNTIEPRQRLRIRNHDRLLAKIAARHHQGSEPALTLRRITKEEIVQRRIRQHHANGRIAGRNALR